MSIEVPLAELGAALADHPWGYLLAVGEGDRPRLLAVPTSFVDGVLRCAAGDGTRAAVAAHPKVCMVFPPPEGTGFSLVVDGDGEVVGGEVHIRPTWAVRHRPALRAAT